MDTSPGGTPPIHALLPRLEAVYLGLACPRAASLRPGLGPDEILALESALPFRLPPEIVELYQWRDGASGPEDEAHPFEGHRFLPLAEAVARYRELTRPAPGGRVGEELASARPDARPGSSWPRSALPLFGARAHVLAIECDPEALRGGRVLEVMDSAGAVEVAPSLAGFIHYVVECFESGAMLLAEDGGLVRDRRRATEVLRRQRRGEAEAALASINGPEDGVCTWDFEGLLRFLDPRAVGPLVEVAGAALRLGDRMRLCAAVTILAKLKDPRAVPVLLSALIDGEPHVAFFAAEGLGAIGDRRATEPLVEMFRRVPPRGAKAAQSVRLEAGAALVRLADPRSLGAALELTEDPDPEVRELALELLGRLVDHGGLPKALAALHDPVPAVVRAAVRALVAIGDASVGPALLERLEDSLLSAKALRGGDPEPPETSVAASAAAALIELGVDEVAPSLATLLDRLGDDLDAGRSEPEIAATLFNLRVVVPVLARTAIGVGRPALARLVDQLNARAEELPRGDIEELVREVELAVTLALADVGDPRGVRLAERLFFELEVADRGRLLAAVAEAGAGYGRDLLHRAIDDLDPEAREQAVREVGLAAREDLALAVAAALEDDSARVRFAAVVALERLGSRTTLPLLRGAGEDAHPAVRGRAARAARTIEERVRSSGPRRREASRPEP